MDRLTQDEQQALKTKLLLIGLKYRDVAGLFGYTRGYVSNVLNGAKYDKRIIDYIKSLPVPHNFHKVMRLIKEKKAA